MDISVCSGEKEANNSIHHVECVPYKGNEPYLFISYSRKDSDIVYPFLKKLQEQRFRVWYDRHGLESGKKFSDILKEKIQGSAAVLLFASKNSLKSEFCGMEVMVAIKHNKRIYPIRLDESSYPSTFSMFLGEIQDIRYCEEDEKEKALELLCNDLPAEAMDRLIKEADSDDSEKYQVIKCKDNGKSIILDDDVVKICENAFKECVRLEEITLSENLDSIGNESFRGCSKLEKIIVPDSTVRIGESAFRDCVSLKSLIIKNRVIKIGERAFENCASLSEVKLPSGLTEIYGGVFNSCKSLKNIELPKELTILGENAFSDCENLESISMPETVTKIDDLVFSGCTSIKEIVLNNGLRKIGKGAFKNCESLEYIEIPSTVSNIGDAPFRGCKSLKSVKVSPKNKSYKSELNRKNGKSGEYVLFNKNKSVIIAYPSASGDETTYDIPDSVTIISNWTFCDCKNLTRIEIPDSVSEIGEGAFCNCTKIEKMEIPDSVIKIDDCVFRGCTSLKEVIIPDTVKDLGWGLFDGCENNVVVSCSEGSEIYKYCIKHNIKISLIEE